MKNKYIVLLQVLIVVLPIIIIAIVYFFNPQSIISNLLKTSRTTTGDIK